MQRLVGLDLWRLDAETEPKTRINSGLGFRPYSFTTTSHSVVRAVREVDPVCQVSDEVSGLRRVGVLTQARTYMCGRLGLGCEWQGVGKSFWETSARPLE